MNELNGVETRKRRSNRLAVFEHVSHKDKKINLKKVSYRKNEREDDSQTSDIELVIDDDDDVTTVRNKQQLIALMLMFERFSCSNRIKSAFKVLGLSRNL